MKKMYKDRLLDFKLVILIVLILPMLGYFLIDSYINLNPILYATTALTGYYTLCISTSIRIWQNKYLNNPFITVILVLIVFPTVGYYVFNLFVPLNPTIFAGAGFGAYFGVCMELGIKLILKK